MALEIKKISELDPAVALDGSELIELEQSSNSVYTDLDTLEAYYLDYLDSYFDFGSDELTILTDLVVNGDLSVDGMILGNLEIQNNLDVNGNLNVDGVITGTLILPKFDSGWLENEMGGAGVADWTNVHLGNDPTDPTDNLTHNLDAPLSELLVKVFYSTDGTDANSFEIYSKAMNPTWAGSSHYGLTVYQVDVNNLKIQTGDGGINFINDAGGYSTPGNIYYKIKVWNLG